MNARLVGVDVGGTFTDVVVADPSSGVVRIAKVPSTPSDQADGVLAGLAEAGVAPKEIERFVHGTTVATNAVLERRGARTVLVVTEGFRDILEIARQNRPKLYDLFADRPPVLVPRELVVGAAERIGVDGETVRPLDDPDAVADAVGRLEPEAVAVCLLYSFLRPDHERAIAEALARRLPAVHVSTSSNVLPVFREYERASTTALNAYVAPAISHYLGGLSGRLRSAGLRGEVEVMRSGGGTFAAGVAARLPVQTLLSGPAAGAWGAAAVAAAAGYRGSIGFDMGGTSTDVTLIEDGAPNRTADGAIGGLPFGVAATDIHTIGSGGGSVAWRDDGGALRVGPRSSGAVPGPACYAKGGSEATVTDAFALLGWLDPTASLGGSIPLDRSLAARAVDALASTIGLTRVACAEGILRIAEAQITAALRVVSVERGKDPRDYALLAFGGAGPLLQGPLSRALGSSAVLVPRSPGVLSAVGLLTAPVAVDLARTRMRDLTGAGSLGGAELEAGWRELERDAGDVLAGQGTEVAGSHRSADCRYRGQAFELEIPAPASDPAVIAAAFHAAHRERYGYAQPEQVVELITLRIRAEGPPSGFALPTVADGRGADAARAGDRTLVIEGREAACPVYRRDALGAGDVLAGPALIEGPDASCLMLAGQRGAVDVTGTLVLTEA